METVQIVLDRELLRAADKAARRRRLNRSAFVREALAAHLRRLAVAEREDRDRAGYVETPDMESRVWDQVAAWPDE